MDPRRGGRARLPRQRDALPALDRLATLDEQRRGVAVYRHPTVAVLEDHEPAERRDAGDGIGHDAIGGRREGRDDGGSDRSEEHTSELQSIQRIEVAAFGVEKKQRTMS